MLRLCDGLSLCSPVLLTLPFGHVQQIVDYEGELLYQGASDNVVITLLKEEFDGRLQQLAMVPFYFSHSILAMSHLT
jgi:hypothetical protein